MGSIKILFILLNARIRLSYYHNHKVDKRSIIGPEHITEGTLGTNLVPVLPRLFQKFMTFLERI